MAVLNQVCTCSYLISPLQFMKLILTVSGKDLSTFMEQWVCRSGIARFHASFNFIRKKNMIELKLKQDIPRGSPKLVVSIVNAYMHLCV